MITTLMACPICGGVSLIRLGVPGTLIGREVFASIEGQLGLSKCRGCGFIFTNPRPHSQLLDRFYSGTTYSCHKPNTSSEASKKAAFLLSLLGKPRSINNSEKRLLDFGCGGGFLLRCARDAGWDASGFDVGKEAVNACRAQGLKVFDSIEKLPAASFDVVTMIHVLEHVFDHAMLFAAFKRVLAPHGKLLIEVPNARSLRATVSIPLLTRYAKFDERYRAFPIHMSFFTHSTLTQLLQKHGFWPSMSSTCGMGVEEILRRSEPHDDYLRSAAPAPSSSKTIRAAKSVIKRCFYSLKLGENLVTIANLSSPSVRRQVSDRSRGCRILPGGVVN
jgi:SAM-dependent methyltransferase